MNRKPKVSVCVPVYGVENYIERCVLSLFEQTYDNIEYIFVDDCSPDNSIGILQNIIEKYPYREADVSIIKHKYNRGLAAARNTAVDLASGEFIMHVDSDDYIDRNAIEFCVSKQQEDNSDIVMFDTIHERNAITYKKVTPSISSPREMCNLLLNGTLLHNVWGKLIRKALYKDNNIYVEEGINMSEDFQVMPRLAYLAEKVSVQNGIYYHYDNTRESSYVNEPFSPRRLSQILRSYEILTVFFLHRDTELYDAVCVAKCRTYIRQRMGACEGGNLEWFDKLSLLLDKCGKRYLEKIPTPYKLTVFIKNIDALYGYIKIMRWIKLKLHK